jgi:5-methylcytosine-specific restriction endonuclease McrA
MNTQYLIKMIKKTLPEAPPLHVTFPKTIREKKIPKVLKRTVITRFTPDQLKALRSIKKKKSPLKERRDLEKKMLRLWSKLIINKHGSKCSWIGCGSTQKIQAHHILPRSVSNRMGWFALDNGMPLCYHCHIIKLKHVTYVDEYIKIRDSFLKVQGSSWDGLHYKYGTRCKIPVWQLEMMYASMASECKRMGIP